MLVYRIMSLNKHQQNYLLERLSYKNSYKTRPDLNIYEPEKNESVFVQVFFVKKTNLIADIQLNITLCPMIAKT